MKSDRRHPHPLRLAPIALAVATLAALSGTAAQAAGYNWSTGYFSDTALPTAFTAADVLAITGGGYKYLNVDAASAGTVRMSDSLYLSGGATFSTAGLFDVQGDAGFYDGGYGGRIVNSGVFQKSSGTGTTQFAGAGFTNNGGVVRVDSGTLNFSSGAFAFNNGSQFTGAGQSVVSGNASFAGSLASGNLSLVSGTFTGAASVVSGTLNWSGGTLAGDWRLAASQTVNLQGGGYKYLVGSFTNQGTVAATDTLYFQSGGSVANQSLYDLQGDVGLGDGGYGGSFVNSGTLRKSVGSGTSTIGPNGSGFTNNGGTIEAQVGTINFNSGALSFNAGSTFTGAGQVVVTGNASFAGAQNGDRLTLAGATYSGTGAVVTGRVAMTGGTLAGDWQVAAGKALELQPGGYKYLNGTLTNKGTITATDTFYLQNNNSLFNQALIDLQGDVGIGDGGYGGNVVNTGTLRKSAGTGTSNIGPNGSGFTNNGGTIDVQVGTLNFNSGALSFNDNTSFTGAGQALVTASASFAGRQYGSNLTLTGATYSGTGAVVNGRIVMTGGTLAGDWEVAAGKALELQPGGYKYLNGTLTNKGTLTATDTFYLQNNNSLFNQALIDLQGDVGIGDGGYGGNVVNTGTLRKSAGTGTSSIGVNGTGFTNNGGTVEARTGTINFNSGALNFNDGTVFTGAGAVVVSVSANFTGNISSQNLQLVSGSFNGGNGGAGSKAVFDGRTTLSSGSLTGQIEMAPTHTLTLAAGGYKYVNGTLNNRGTVNAADTLYLQNGNVLTNNGVYRLQADVGVADGGYNGSFVNNGLLVKSAGSGTSDVSGIGFVNNGTVQVSTGTIQLPANFNNAGTLKGSGTLATNLLTNSGHVAPGESPGTLTIAGSFAQLAGGSLDIELAGPTSADRLVVSGSASLAGTLALSCFGSCNLAVGQTFTLLDAAPNALTGSFASVTLAGFQTGAFSVVYDRALGDVLLTVTAAATPAVPEPGGWALLLAGLGALGWVTRRRGAGRG